MAARKDYAERAAAAGIPDSRPFIAPEDEPIRTEQRDWSQLTINGQPVPEAAWNVIPYEATDQGAKERNERIREMNGGRDPGPRVEFGRDSQDKEIDRYGDDLYLSIPNGEAHDPLRAPMDKHTPKGMRGCWLSDKRVAKDGRDRDIIRWQPLYVSDGKGGRELVRQGNMTLCVIPEEAAKQADDYYARKAQERSVKAAAKQEEFAERAGYNGSIRKLGEGVVSDDTEAAAREAGIEF